MSPEVSLFHDVWEIVKNHIHIKERVETAESLLTAFEDHIDLADLEFHKNEFDKWVKAAIISKYEDELDDEDDEDGDEW
jgi:hypothetical protein